MWINNKDNQGTFAAINLQIQERGRHILNNVGYIRPAVHFSCKIGPASPSRGIWVFTRQVIHIVLYLSLYAAESIPKSKIRYSQDCSKIKSHDVRDKDGL